METFIWFMFITNAISFLLYLICLPVFCCIKEARSKIPLTFLSVLYTGAITMWTAILLFK